MTQPLLLPQTNRPQAGQLGTGVRSFLANSCRTLLLPGSTFIGCALCITKSRRCGPPEGKRFQVTCLPKLPRRSEAARSRPARCNPPLVAHGPRGLGTCCARCPTLDLQMLSHSRLSPEVATPGTRGAVPSPSPPLRTARPRPLRSARLSAAPDPRRVLGKHSTRRMRRTPRFTRPVHPAPCLSVVAPRGTGVWSAARPASRPPSLWATSVSCLRGPGRHPGPERGAFGSRSRGTRPARSPRGALVRGSEGRRLPAPQDVDLRQEFGSHRTTSLVMC